jgi:hypothetical protein
MAGFEKRELPDFRSLADALQYATDKAVDVMNYSLLTK